MNHFGSTLLLVHGARDVPLSPLRNGLLACTIFTDIVVSVFALVRIYAMYYVKHVAHLEDLSCLASWILYMAYSVCLIRAIEYGEGVVVSSVTLEDYALYLLWTSISSLFFTLATMFNKLTLLLVLRRILASQPNNHMIRTTVTGLIGALVLWFVPVFILRIAACGSFKILWNPSATKGSICSEFLRLAPSIGSVPIDFATFTIPILMVWPHHNMSLGKKIRIIALLSTGGVASIFSVWRMVQLIDYADTTDPTMALVYVNIADICEIGLGIVCACLPATSCLYRYIHGPERDQHDPNVPRTGLLSRQRRLRKLQEQGEDDVESGITLEELDGGTRNEVNGGDQQLDTIKESSSERTPKTDTQYPHNTGHQGWMLALGINAA